MIRSGVLVKFLVPKLRREQAVKLCNKSTSQPVLNGVCKPCRIDSIRSFNHELDFCFIKHNVYRLNKRCYAKDKGVADESCTIVDQSTPITVKDSEKVRINTRSNVDEQEIPPPTGELNNTTPPKDSLPKVTGKKPRPKFDHNYKSTERNFITAVRAMNEYLLKPAELEGLRKTVRRSPFDNAPAITVYLRKDVEAKALLVYGSREALARELKKKQEQDRQYKQLFSNSDLFQIKMTVKEYREQSESERKKFKQQETLFRGSGRVVLTAITINTCNFTLKLLAWMYTGSHSLFSEAVHSFADTCNQLILAYGIHKSIQVADYDHPYGYMNMRYVASLISGVGIFCFGTGLSIYHGIMGLLNPEEIASLYWAFFILGGSLVSEGATLLVALNTIRRGAKKSRMTVKDYIVRAQDPLVNVVLLEDLAAVIGVSIAATCMGLSLLLESPIPDSVGSLLIGCLLGAIAAFIINTNSAALVGRSIPYNKLERINRELETDVMIRAIHDAKCLDLGNGLARYKAELDFDGRELTRSYLDKQDLELLLDEMQKMKTMDEVESFMLKHGENVIDLVGAEIDRIETQLRKRHPEIRHCDLEIL